jgi:hypothetical protein
MRNFMVDAKRLNQVKKCVGFVFTTDDKNKLVPQGTGFFVRVLQEDNPEREVDYFITAKHVLEDARHNLVEQFIWRLNKIDDGCQHDVISTKE